MNLIRAIGSGLAAGLRSWRMALWLWLLTLVAALPAAMFMEETIHEFIGSSLAHETLKGQMDLAWLAELQDEGGGLSSLLTPSRLSAAAPFDNLESWFSGGLFQGNLGLVSLGIVFALLWTLMSGGVLCHLIVRERPAGLAALLSDGIRYLFRFLRLVLAAGVAYYLIYRFSLWLFPWLETATRDVTVERTVLSINLLAAALVAFLLIVVKVTVDYAKISTVLEERRSMTGAALRGFQFVVTHPIRALGVYSIMGLLGLLLAAVFYTPAPGVGSPGVGSILIALVVGQLYLLLRWALRISLLGAESSVFQAARKNRGRSSSSL
jgi:hypothetical protein